jgi:hypothetical protein
MIFEEVVIENPNTWFDMRRELYNPIPNKYIGTADFLIPRKKGPETLRQTKKDLAQ